MGSFILRFVHKSTLLILAASAIAGVTSTRASVKNKSNQTITTAVANFKSRLSGIKAQRDKILQQMVSKGAKFRTPLSARKGRISSFRQAYLPYSVGTITVNTVADSAAANPATSDTTIHGTVSLRSAIQYTNAIAGADTIIVPAGTYTLTISPLGGDTAGTGDLDINDSLTIIGAGENETVIDGNQIDRIFNIGSINTNISVKLSGLTVMNGYSSSSNPDDAGFGGGMEVNGGVVELDSVNMTNNRSDLSGGGIGIYGGTFIMNYGSLSNNIADAGGTHDPSDDGGGADIWSGTSTFNGVAIDSNIAVIGGGIDNFFGGSGANLIFSNCEFINDSTSFGQFYYGGGLENFLGDFTIDHCTFENCYGDGDGGAIDIRAGANTITNSVFEGNHSLGASGAIHDLGTSLTMTGDTVVWNTATNDIGAIFTASQFKMQNSFVGHNSTTSDGSGHLTGGIALGGIDTLINVSIRGNSADLGAGVSTDSNSIYFSQVDIDSNAALLFGGGMFAVNYTNAYLSQVYVDNNAALAEDGGGLLIANSSFHLSQVYVDSNQAMGGGGIDDESGGIIWHDGSLSYNIASAQGGGMLFDGAANDTLYNIAITGNSPDQIFDATSGAFDVVIIDNSLAVQATDFVATSDAGSVTLSWNTQSEVDNSGFNILREDPGTSSFRLISSYTTNDALRGMGTNSTGKSYNYTDNKVTSGSTYQYEIQSVSIDGTTKDLSTLSVTVNVPKTYALYQNYPNPFNPSTTIRFDLKEQSTVALDIYNVLGQRVLESNYGTMSAGRYDENINMDRFASGVYLYRIAAQGNNGEKFVSIKKLMLIK